MIYVYILYSKFLDKYYIGEAINLENRIKQHNSGFYDSAYTKNANDWIVYYTIACKERIQARKIETHIKKMKSKLYIQNMKKYPDITKKLLDKYK